MTRLRLCPSLGVQPAGDVISTQAATESASAALTLKARSKRILALALPIIGGMASQNVLNLIDTAMVGQLGAAALGAVGLGGIANWLAAAFFLGMGSGVQAVAARRVGQRDSSGAVFAVHAALVVALVLVLPYSLVLASQADAIFGLLTSNPEIASEGASYLSIRMCAAVFVVANFSFRGYWNGTGRSIIYLRTILVIHATNIFLNWVLIYGNLGMPKMGVSGAAVASAIAVGLGTVTYVALGIRHARADGFLKRGAIDKETTKSVIRLSIPTGIRSLFFSAGILAFYRIAELLGEDELGATTALINLALVCMLPAMGFGLASATFVGNELGAERPREAFRWAWTTVGLASATLVVLGLILAAAPSLWLDLLMDAPRAEYMAVIPLVIIALYQPVDAVGQVLSLSLVGAGATRTEMLVTLSTQWGFFLPLAYVWGVHFEGGLLALFVAMCLWRCVYGVLMVVIWQAGRWASIKV